MSLSRLLFLGLFACNSAWALEGFMIGAGAEGDGEGGLSIAAIGGLGLSEATWFSAGLGQSSVDLGNGRELETLYADLELDHHFDPLGIRLGLAYWGDSDVLESNDWRASVYWRNDTAMISLDYEYRDFDFTIPSLDFLSARDVEFDADGIGASARFKFGDNVSLRVRGVKYDYSIPFRPVENVDAARLVNVSRLSLINSLVDHRAGVALSIDRGLRNWEIDVATWEGVFDRSRTRSVTLRFLTPMSQRSDIEFGVGYDDSDRYGDVTFFSLYLYFYGGN